MIKNLSVNIATGEVGKSFVGIKVVNNQLTFFYPEAYQLSENDENIKKDILNIIRTINITKKRSQENSNYNSKFKENEKFPLVSYLWILNDYIENKRYINKEAKYKYGQQGKICWNKTIRQIPFFSNNSIIFPHLISSVNQQKDNILTEIYSYCVFKAIEEIGWYYNIYSVEENCCRFNFNKGKYISLLKDEIRQTFDDKKRQRLIHLKNIITGLDSKNIQTKNIVYGVDSYEYVFEFMIDEMFSNIDFKKTFFPNASWNLRINGNVDSSKLRPDTIFIKNRKVYIIDSKFYRYGTTFNPKDLPNTSSIEKQITYGEFAKKIGKDYDAVYNAFILPYNKQRKHELQDKFKLKENLVFVGTAIANWTQQIPEEYKIATFLIDLKFLIENYLKNNDKMVDDLINKIENNIK